MMETNFTVSCFRMGQGKREREYEEGEKEKRRKTEEADASFKRSTLKKSDASETEHFSLLRYVLTTTTTATTTTALQTATTMSWTPIVEAIGISD